MEDCCLVLCRYRWWFHFLLLLLLLSCWPQFLWKMNLTKMLNRRLTPPPCMRILAYCALKPQTVIGRDQYDRSSHEMMKQSYNACTLLHPGKSWTVCFFWRGGRMTLYHIVWCVPLIRIEWWMKFLSNLNLCPCVPLYQYCTEYSLYVQNLGYWLLPSWNTLRLFFLLLRKWHWQR